MTHRIDPDPTVPLQPDREYDQPGGPRLGHAAALNVPCSEGPAHYELEPSEASTSELIAEEPKIEPHRQMEAGTEWDPETVARLGPLFTPLHEVHDVD